MPTSEAPNYLPISEQLRILFESITRADGHPYTLQEISDQIGVSLTTISQIRTGKIQYPRIDTLRALCQFFDIPLTYFATTSAAECYAILAERSEHRPAGRSSEIAFRATNLSSKAQDDILNMIRWIQMAEKNGGDTGNAENLNSHIDDLNGAD